MENTNTPRHKLARKAALWNERSSWVSHWREISESLQPRLGRYFIDDVNRGQKRSTSIYDNHAGMASRTLAAGMMSGMTSPARPWFKLDLADKDLMESQRVKTWLARSAELMRTIYAQSNTYRALHCGYEELGLFGSWATVCLPNFNTVLHHYPLTIGEYALACNYEGYVDTLAREFKMTVAQLVRMFGKENCSQTVRNLFDTNKLESWVPVAHLVEPREERDTRKLDAKNMRWSSCYIECGRDNPDKYLRESGFKRFPVLAPRWEVKGNDIYGNSPGMMALGDARQLQHEQLRKSQAIDYKVNPPLQVPSAYKDQAMNRLPGGIMFVDATHAGGGVRSAFQVDLDLGALREDIIDVRQRIDRAFYVDLFMMLANDTRSGITATEVAERHEEKLVMLGPVLERLHNELLSPMIDMTFDYCLEAGILPPIPDELRDHDINVEFTSTLAQAQRIVAAGGVDRLLGAIGSLSALKPDIVDKVDLDQVVDDFGTMFGVNPEIIVPDEQVAQMRAERAKAEQAAQQGAAMAQAAESAKTIGETNTDGVKDAISMFQGYSGG